MEFKEYYTVEDTSNVKLQASEEGVQNWQAAGYGLSVHWVNEWA